MPGLLDSPNSFLNYDPEAPVPKGNFSDSPSYYPQTHTPGIQGGADPSHRYASQSRAPVDSNRPGVVDEYESFLPPMPPPRDVRESDSLRSSVVEEMNVPSITFTAADGSPVTSGMSRHLSGGGSERYSRAESQRGSAGPNEQATVLDHSSFGTNRNSGASLASEPEKPLHKPPPSWARYSSSSRSNPSETDQTKSAKDDNWFRDL